MLYFQGMLGPFSLFTEVAIILTLATGMAFLMRHLRLPLILGHIITYLGWSCFLGVMQNDVSLRIFSIWGLPAFLFIVGLQLHPRLFRDVGSSALITGVVQILGMTVTGCLCKLVRLSDGRAWLVGFMVSLSSTIVITKVLSDRKDDGKLYGKMTIGILLMQDFCHPCHCCASTRDAADAIFFDHASSPVGESGAACRGRLAWRARAFA